VENSQAQRQGRFYEPLQSIGVFANKGTVKAYVVVGLRSQRKRGAYYAPWQLMGRKERFPAKKFIDKALDNSDVPEKAAQKITNFVQKRIKAHLR
jgi:hypothetical protein